MFKCLKDEAVQSIREYIGVAPGDKYSTFITADENYAKKRIKT